MSEKFLNCPYCGFRFKVLLVNADNLPDIAPIVCESCAEVGLVTDGRTERITLSQLEWLKQSPAWRDVIEPALKIIHEHKAENERRARLAIETAVPSVDRSKRTLTDGSPVTPDHREIVPETGMQKGYVVLSAEERAKGFVRPVRREYTHLKCKDNTVMGLSLAETYARDPKFYDGTFCVSCRAHFPLDQFVWAGTDEQVGS